MPPEVATLFNQEAGIHVVHRIRKQGMRKEGIPDYPLRIAENWYPSDLALPFLTEAELAELQNASDRYAADMIAQVTAEQESA